MWRNKFIVGDNKVVLRSNYDILKFVVQNSLLFNLILIWFLYALIFVGTLVTRMFGQKKTKDGCTLNTMSFDELAVHYPDLPLFMLDKLSLSKESLHSIHVQPSLFPVLTLLSNLGASEKMDNNTVRLVESTAKLQQVYFF